MDDIFLASKTLSITLPGDGGGAPVTYTIPAHGLLSLASADVDSDMENFLISVLNEAWAAIVLKGTGVAQPPFSGSGVTSFGLV